METGKIIYAKIVDTIEPITRIEFSVYGNKDVIRDSVIDDPNGITIPETYSNNVPVRGGAIDRRLGVTDKSQCATCGEFALRCPGHFGHIRFMDPVFHVGFNHFVKNILNCICIRCSKLLVYRNETEISAVLKNKQGKQRYNEIKEICKHSTHCQKKNYGCGTPAHRVTIDSKTFGVIFLAEPSKKVVSEEEENQKATPQILTAQFIYDTFCAISDADCLVLGFDPTKSRPEDMIIVNFPVPPVQVRPSVRVEISSTSTFDDDLTHKIIDIIKHNETLKNNKGNGSLVKSSCNDDYVLLQIHVATFFANDSAGFPVSQQKNKKATKSLSERLKGKEGRVRANLMGKRVDMSGRTVITSDPNISLNEVGIPLMIAMNLTYPEIVTTQNIHYLTQLVRNGKKKYPGANFVTKTVIDKEGNEEKHTYLLKYAGKPIDLKPGDIVERHLVDGDMVLLNRQPTLHKLSMMGHKCTIIPDAGMITFRINVSVTDPYNADFDGDEMNIHVPQSIQAVTELRLIANASLRFVSPTNSRVAINPKQDTVMGSYVMTKTDTMIDWKDAMNILMHTTVRLDANIPKHTLLTGRFVYSKIIQDRLNLYRKKDDEYVLKIVNGLLTDGMLTKSYISAIVQKLWFQYSNVVCQNFIDDLQKMILQFLMKFGYTVGIKDTIVPQKVHDDIYTLIETKRSEAMAAITKYENDPSIMTPEAFEINLEQGLKNAIQNHVQQLIMNNLDSTGGIYNAISSGSSGTDMNAGQIIGCIGQVVVEDKRIQKRFNNRTLPTFAQHDDSPFARGFCVGSFISGLNPMEFFFQVMAGREGVINTAIVTADKPRNMGYFYSCQQQVAALEVGKYSSKGKNSVNFPRQLYITT